MWCASMGEDWGVPDWREADPYPSTEETTAREWWWEFTRRRPDYRDLWEQAKPREGCSHRFAPDVDAFRIRFELSVIHDPSRRYTDSDLMHYRYARAGALYSPRDVFLNSVGHMPDAPDTANADRLSKLQEAEGLFHYSFDLSKPLGPQLEHAEAFLRDVQADLSGSVLTRRARTANWPLFLRALDAKDAGATYREMRDVFWPSRAERSDGKEGKTEQSARDTYKAACELRDNFPI